MGAVYRALDVQLGRRVALKVLREEFKNDVGFIAQLDNEARITASITYPHVVRVFNRGACHGMYYICFELIEGGSLAELIQKQGHLAESYVLEFSIQIASGLRAVFQKGLIHRDVKPGNILLSNTSVAKIVDFGIAAFQGDSDADSAAVWGSPNYIAPEKLQRTKDFRSDIYSLGATLFHALTGRPVFGTGDPRTIAMKHLQSNAISVQAFAPHVTNSTAFCINRMLMKNPEERFQNYDELIASLEYARDQLKTVQATAKSIRVGATVVSKQKQRRRVLPWLMAGGVAAVSLVAIFLIATASSVGRRN